MGLIKIPQKITKTGIRYQFDMRLYSFFLSLFINFSLQSDVKTNRDPFWSFASVLEPSRHLSFESTHYECLNHSVISRISYVAVYTLFNNLPSFQNHYFAGIDNRCKSVSHYDAGSANSSIV